MRTIKGFQSFSEFDNKVKHVASRLNIPIVDFKKWSVASFYIAMELMELK